MTFESIDSIPSSHVHFPSAASTTPSQLLLSLSPCRILRNTPPLMMSCSSVITLPSMTSHPLRPLFPAHGRWPRNFGLDQKRRWGSFRRSWSRPYQSFLLRSIEISHTILRQAVLMFLQPSMCFEIDVSGDSEPEKTKLVDLPSPPRRSLTRNVSASTASSSLKRTSKTGGSSKVDRG